MFYKTEYQKLYMFIAFSMSLVFLFVLRAGPLGVEGHLDSWSAISEQFIEKWLNESGIKKFEYFIAVSNWPHPKIILRILTLVDYYVFNTIDIYRIDIYCNLGILIGLYVIFNIWFKKNLYLIFPIIASLLFVTKANYWTVLSVGLGFSFITSVLLFYFLFKKKYLLCTFFLTLALFRSGAGFLILVPFLISILFLRNKKEMSNKVLFWFAFIIIVNLGLFYFVTLYGNLSNPRIKEFDITLIERLPSLIIYFFKVIGCFPSSEILFDTNIKNLNVGLGIFISLLYIYLILKSNWANLKSQIAISVGFYYFLLCVIAAYINDNPTILNERVIGRYNYLSMLFWISCYLLFISNENIVRSSKKILLPISFLFVSFFFYKSINSYEDLVKYGKFRKMALFNSFVGDVKTNPKLVKNEKKLFYTKKIYLDAVNKGLMKPINFTSIYNKEQLGIEFNEKESIDTESYMFKFSNAELAKINIAVSIKFDSLFVNINNKFYSAKSSKNKSGNLFVYSYYLPAQDIGEEVECFGFSKGEVTRMVAESNWKKYLFDKRYLKVKNENDREKIFKIEKDFYLEMENIFSQDISDFKLSYSKKYRRKSKQIKKIMNHY